MHIADSPGASNCRQTAEVLGIMYVWSVVLISGFKRAAAEGSCRRKACRGWSEWCLTSRFPPSANRRALLVWTPQTTQSHIASLLRSTLPLTLPLHGPRRVPQSSILTATHVGGAPASGSPSVLNLDIPSPHPIRFFESAPAAPETLRCPSATVRSCNYCPRTITRVNSWPGSALRSLFVRLLVASKGCWT